MDAGKSFELELRRGYSRLALHPNLNAFRWEEVEQSAARILGEIDALNSPAVIVDLSPVDYLGSAQLTLLVRIWKSIKARDGRMVVHVTAPVVREVLNTAGLNSLWELVETHTAAVEALGLNSDGRPHMSSAWPVFGVIALLVALGACGLTFWRPGTIRPQVLMGLQLGCSALALVAGLVTAMRGAGFRRGVGVALVLTSACLAVVEGIRIGSIETALARDDSAEDNQSGATDDATGEETVPDPENTVDPTDIPVDFGKT